MNELQIFNHETFGEIRSVTLDGEPYFVGVDVARALEYAAPSKAVIDHCKGITKLVIPSGRGEQETNVIPLGDVCRLIVKAATQSRNPEIQEKAEAYES
jgi:prophage antirepressor-like protein